MLDYFYKITKYSVSNFNYFDGSFYLGVKLANSGKIKWGAAYNEAKQKVFNGMNGYLINITSEEDAEVELDIAVTERAAKTGHAALIHHPDDTYTIEIPPLTFEANSTGV